MDRATQRQEVEYLLTEWFAWSDRYRPKTGIPRVAPMFGQSVTSRQWEDSTDASCSRLHGQQMTAVDFCVDQLPAMYRTTIGIEMRNRQVSARVWRHRADAAQFAEAIESLIPIMLKEGLIE